MRSLSLLMSECSQSKRGQGHVNNFHIVDLENFATTSRWNSGPWSVCYRAMLCIRGTSHGPVSVCLCMSVSVCVCVCLSQAGVLLKRQNVGSNKQHHTIPQVVFCCQRSPRNSTGVTPYEGDECRWGGSKSATFDIYPAISRKR